MKTMKDVGKDLILAGLGTIDQQNDEIKDLLRKGSAVFGMGEVDNEELTYNGNREEIEAKKRAKAAEDHKYDLGHGRSVSYSTEKDEDGKVKERTLEFEKRPDDTYHEVEIEFSRTPAEEAKTELSVEEPAEEPNKEEPVEEPAEEPNKGDSAE